MTQQNLVERAFSDPSTIRQMMVSLEGRGWIRRKPSPEDARAKLVSLTPEGRKQQRRLRRIGQIGDPTCMEGLLTTAELQTVLDCLERIIRAQSVNWRSSVAAFELGSPLTSSSS